MRKKTFIFIRIIFIFLVLLFLFQFAPPTFPRTFWGKSENEVFIVGQDLSQQALIEELHSRGFIRNPAAFKLILKIQNWENQIKPGGYLISKGMSVFEIAENLVIPSPQKWVQIPEGLRKEEVVKILQLNLNWQDFQKKDFLQRAKEGYLFPDTYLFPLDWSGSNVAERLEGQFVYEFKENSDKDFNSDTVILASLVQREAANKTEMPQIAGIILKRYQKNFLLQVDAALQYALGVPKKWWPVVWPEDRKIDSLYNTYRYLGYPPTPICSPGPEAIKAAINPQETDYLYYLHDGNRKIHYARTYKEHLINIDKYLR